MSSPIGQNSVVVVPGVLPAQMEEERKTSTTGADAGDGPREAAPTAPDATTITTTTTTTTTTNDNKYVFIRFRRKIDAMPGLVVMHNACIGCKGVQ